MEFATNSELDALKAVLTAEFALLRRDIELLRCDLTFRFGSMIIVAVGILLVAIRFLPRAYP